MSARKDYIKIELLAGGVFRGELKYPHSPLFKLDIEDMVRFIYEKRPTLKYEKEVEVWLNGRQQCFITPKRKVA